MLIQFLLTRILVDGSILTGLMAVILVGMLYVNPRLALSDYPEDVKDAVPPRPIPFGSGTEGVKK